ncbi:MAG TPA: hypothetical protein VF691_04890 [Cytophagaceae bacterium]|jgi:aldehyde:ferredoxin oxidoreductase
MESEEEILRKYLPMIFELDFNVTAPHFVHSWYNMSWYDFEKEMQKASISCDNCKVRDWKEFFSKQHDALNQKGEKTA